MSRFVTFLICSVVATGHYATVNRLVAESRHGNGNGMNCSEFPNSSNHKLEIFR